MDWGLSCQIIERYIPRHCEYSVYRRWATRKTSCGYNRCRIHQHHKIGICVWIFFFFSSEVGPSYKAVIIQRLRPLSGGKIMKSDTSHPKRWLRPRVTGLEITQIGSSARWLGSLPLNHQLFTFSPPWSDATRTVASSDVCSLEISIQVVSGKCFLCPFNTTCAVKPGITYYLLPRLFSVGFTKVRWTENSAKNSSKVLQSKTTRASLMARENLHSWTSSTEFEFIFIFAVSPRPRFTSFPIKFGTNKVRKGRCAPGRTHGKKRQRLRLVGYK